MNKKDLLDYARRDWALLAESKASYWAERTRIGGLGEAIGVGDELRKQTVFLHPSWPSEEDRAKDMETHARVAACLRRVASRRRP